MNDSPFISVVIPLYNKEGNIKKTIQSVLNQTYDKYEIVIINDGSTDNSATVVKSLGNEKIRLINKPNGGVSSARNRGIIESRYDYIAFLDADDFWDENYLEEMSSLINLFPDSSLFGCRFDYYKNSQFFPAADTILLPDSKSIISNYFSIVRNNLLYWSSSSIVSKQDILALGGFDERMSIGEDLDLWFRMILNYQVSYYNKVLAHYNLDAINRAMKNKHDFSRSYLYYIDKYKKWEKDNREFCIFINLHRCIELVNILANYKIKRKDLNHYIQTINYSVVPWKWKIFNGLPYLLKKKVAEYYNRKSKALIYE